MTSEIVPFVEESDTSPSAEPDCTGKKGKAAVVVSGDSDANAGRHGFDPCADIQETQDLRRLDMLGVSRPDDFVTKNNIVGMNHDLTHFISPDKSPKYTTQLNPTLFSVNSLIKEMKEAFVLQLRGCDQLLLPSVDFPFSKFKALTALEISGCTNLTTLPEKALSEMNQLQTLNLSHLSIQQLPDDFFSNLTNLRSLILRSCANLHSLPEFSQMTALQHLDLSFNLLIETLPPSLFPGLNKLEHLILRGCCKLCSLPSMEPLEKLKVLDLSHCTALQELKSIDLHIQILEMLDLSYTVLHSIPNLGYQSSLTHIFLKDAELYMLENIDVFFLRVLDLSGARNLKDLGLLERFRNLEALDLSRTGIESIGFGSQPWNLDNLRYLILRECTSLVQLPELERLINLEVFDISGCELLVDLPEDLSSLQELKELNLSGCSGLGELREGLFNKMSRLEKLDLSKTNLTCLPSFANLTSLQTLNISHTSLEQVPDFSNLNLKEFICVDSHKLKDPGSSSFENLRGGVSWDDNNTLSKCLQASNSKPNEIHLTSTFFSSKSSVFDKFIVEFIELDSRISYIQRDLPNLSSTYDDLKYIYDNINLLESSGNCQEAEKLLLVLFTSTNVSRPTHKRMKNLHPTIVKLKLLIPPKQGGGLKEYIDEEEVDKEREYVEVEVKEDKEIEDEEVEEDEEETDQRGYLWVTAFTSLTEVEKNCLLYLAIFPLYENFLIEERILIQLWHGEGFIDTRHDATVEEIGRRILMVLDQKRLIWRKLMADTESRIMHMDHLKHTFIKTQAKKLHLFDLTGCQIACLVKSKNKFPSFCNIGVPDTNSYEYLKHLEPIRTLININECNLDIKADWFSKMTNLVVLQLGSRNSKYKHIEVVDLKFLEELKNMKKLMLLSLEGFTSLLKLPDCVCKTTSLKILNLRDCTYLEELPAGIGYLENLTHLDVTHCRLLSKLPKGIELLSRLEVLKGFLITYEAGGEQHRKACTLRDLLKLKKLRKLNLVVNKDGFPDHKDLQVLKDMKNLCNLKITWEKNYDSYLKSEDVVGREALRRHSRWQYLKCWKVQTRQNDADEPVRSLNDFHNLKKLVLCCFPLATAPNWLHPSELHKLEKLYIVGGGLKTVAGDTNPSTWNLQTLRLRYLRNFEMEWEELKRNFPHMSRFEKHKCDHLSSCPRDKDYNWIRKWEFGGITSAREQPQCFVRRKRDGDADADDDDDDADDDDDDDDDGGGDVDDDDGGDDDDNVVSSGLLT